MGGNFSPPCKRGDIVAILHVVGPLEYWNMVYGIRESNPPDLKNSETYLGSIWKDCILPPVSQYGNPNWFPLPWMYLLLWKSYKCNWQRIALREGDFFTIGPMCWHFIEIVKYHQGLCYIETNHPIAYLPSIYRTQRDLRSVTSSSATRIGVLNMY